MEKHSIKGIEQGRAKFAYEAAQKGEKLGGGKKKNDKGDKLEDSKEAKEFKSYVKKTPMMIKTNGLGAAFAFIKSKSKKDAYDLIYKQTHEWLKKSEITKHILDTSNSSDLVEIIISQDSWNYRTLTVEVLAFFGWLRRFADGLIEGESEEE